MMELHVRWTLAIAKNAIILISRSIPLLPSARGSAREPPPPSKPALLTLFHTHGHREKHPQPLMLLLEIPMTSPYRTFTAAKAPPPIPSERGIIFSPPIL